MVKSFPNLDTHQSGKMTTPCNGTVNKVLPNKLATIFKNRRNASTRISSEFHLKLTMNHHNYVAYRVSPQRTTAWH